MTLTRLLCLCLAITACGATPPQSLPDASSAPDSTATDANPCLAVEGLSCACGAALGTWRCAGAMPVCVCDRPDAQADTPDTSDVIDAPPIACDVGTYCMQSGGCVNTSVNILHCGRCGNRCAAGLVCEDGTCISADASVRDVYRDMGVDTRAFIDLDVYPNCRVNLDCNNSLDDGCESNPMTDPDHCGGCDGPRCGGNAARYVLPACRNGMCTGRCAAGRYNCDGDAVNGCESTINYTGCRTDI